ncbi:MAG: dihydropteroate synthase [candidate division KSB1 bacterium]|nr:dihydropteroate synthase [candidate division KSB1 bacterium]MDZ7294522.1 dihydropteroate synthase [candidate division KSB1 bacterium]MDZ7384742.1 dihydropteroate synthase [candidate division KSB1 bacterium]MDZ7392312.1 dihydropteroate synthase [candidate division KSB1 bacterium]
MDQKTTTFSTVHTVLWRADGRTVVIGADMPVVVIGEKINPTGKKAFADELRRGDLSRVRTWAREQTEAGAGVIEVNVGTDGINEAELLPAAVEAAMESTDLPLSIDTANPKAMEAALTVYKGKALLNSTTGESHRLEAILPVAVAHKAAIVGLCYDEKGISAEPHTRLQVAEKIVNKAAAAGLSIEDVVLDPLAFPVSTDHCAALVTLETARLIRAHIGTNLTLGVSNTSFGLPDRPALNVTMLVLAIAAGVTCPIVDPTRPEIMRAVKACDLLTGRDEMAMRWIQHFRATGSKQRDTG